MMTMLMIAMTTTTTVVEDDKGLSTPHILGVFRPPLPPVDQWERRLGSVLGLSSLLVHLYALDQWERRRGSGCGYKE